MNKKKPNKYWTYEKCKEEAIKFKTRSDFRDKSSGAYYASLKNNWIEDICVHMTKFGNRRLRCIYSYEFIEDKSVYVGLTYNIIERQNTRNSRNDDQVTKHIIETGFKPIRKQLTDYIDVELVSKLEGEYVEKYKNKHENRGLLLSCFCLAWLGDPHGICWHHEDG